MLFCSAGELELGDNQISGSIPSNLGEMKSLKYLSLFTNRLTGSLPSLSGLSNLQELNLSVNDFVGTIPGSWGALSHLEHIDLVQVTDLSGTIPSSFSSLTSLKWLRFDDTSVEGSIADVIGKFPSLGTCIVYVIEHANRVFSQQSNRQKYLGLQAPVLLGVCQQQLG